MSSKTPPIPPDNRSPKGTGSDPAPQASDLASSPGERGNEDAPDRADTRRDTTVKGNAGKRVRT